MPEVVGIVPPIIEISLELGLQPIIKVSTDGRSLRPGPAPIVPSNDNWYRLDHLLAPVALERQKNSSSLNSSLSTNEVEQYLRQSNDKTNELCVLDAIRESRVDLSDVYLQQM